MKVKLLVGIICLFALSTLAIAQDATLSLNAVFDKSEYRVGQPVKLTATITNNSSAGVIILWSVSKVTMESGGESLFKPKGMSGARGEGRALKPRDSWTHELEYSSESFNMPTPGNYQVTIAYKNDQEKTAEGNARMKGKQRELWTGEVKTTATLKIIN